MKHYDFSEIFIKFKNEIIMALFSLFTFLTPIYGMAILVTGAVALDTFAGVYIARRNNDYQSDKLFNVVVKTFFYMATILLAFMIDKHIFEDKIANIGFFSSKAVTMFWLYIEAKSLDEKSQKLNNKPFHIIMTDFIKRIKAWKKDINEIKED